ncbi:MAG: thymidine phosphorylase [Clostridiales bacterium]|nr:thymidine phosphorylase [Clostridiales bacterium]
MRMVDLIVKKRQGQALSEAEIAWMIQAYTEGALPDYQMSAMMMAICFAGMNAEETAALTDAMTHSGTVLDVSSVGAQVADKHSTGGVADTTTLAVVPIVASCGVTMGKMSGRGLGHTGGTLDKLEAISGFSVDVAPQRFLALLRENGLAIVGQNEALAPADKKLYALRDVTGTVDSLPLIASSIMSKKLAAGADIIVLDVKVGSGAFMKTPEDAAALAKTMVEIGVHLGKKTAALITDMNQPLGSCIGNALDVREAIEILQGKHQDSDLFAICKRLSAQLIRLGGKAEEEREAERMVLDAIASGRALQKLATMIQAQGGDARVCQDTSRLPSAERIIPVLSQQAGYIAKMDTQSIGTCAQMLGAGREKLGDKIDPAVGIVMKKRVGDFVRTGDVLAEFHVNEQNMLQEAMRRFSAAFAYSKKPVDPPKLVYGLVDEQGLHDE